MNVSFKGLSGFPGKGCNSVGVTNRKVYKGYNSSFFMDLDNNQSEKPSFGVENLTENVKYTDGSFLQKVGSERINSLKESVHEIGFLIKEREMLSKTITEEADKIKNSIENFLLTNKASDTDGFRERNGLRQKQIEISELELNEKVNCWRDVALLKKELRERQKELTEKQERMAILGEIGG